MNRDAIHIPATNNTPDIMLDPHGIIKISGRAIDESRNKFSDQLMTWTDSYILNPASKTEITIALEYMNSFNSIFIASVLKKLAQLSRYQIKWYIEEDDDDLLERANHISSAFNIPIEFILTDQIRAM